MAVSNEKWPWKKKFIKAVVTEKTEQNTLKKWNHSIFIMGVMNTI